MLPMALLIVGILPSLSIASRKPHCIVSSQPPDADQLREDAFHGLRELKKEWGNHVISFASKDFDVPGSYRTPVYITKDGITAYPDQSVHGAIEINSFGVEHALWRDIDFAARLVYRKCIVGIGNTNAGSVEVEGTQYLDLYLVDPHAVIPSTANSTISRLSLARGAS